MALGQNEFHIHSWPHAARRTRTRACLFWWPNDFVNPLPVGSVARLTPLGSTNWAGEPVSLGNDMSSSEMPFLLHHNEAEVQRTWIKLNHSWLRQAQETDRTPQQLAPEGTFQGNARVKSG